MRTFTFLIVLFLSCRVTEIRSQETRSFALSDLFNISNISAASISPNGRKAAVVIERPRNQQKIYSYRGISFRKDIWLLDIESGSMNMILDGAKDSCSYWNPVWSTDSKKLAVLSTIGEDNVRAFVYERDKNKLIQVDEAGVNLMTKTYQGELGFNDPYLWLDAENLIVSLLPSGHSYNTFQMDHLPIKTIREEWLNTKYNLQHTASVLDSDSINVFPNDQASYLVRYNLEDNSITPLDTGYFRHVIISPSKKILFVVKRNGGRNLGEIDLITSAWNFNHQAGFIDLISKEKYYVDQRELNVLATPGSNPHFWTGNDHFILIKDIKKHYCGYIDIRKQRFQKFKQTFTTIKKEGQDFYLKSESGWYKFNRENSKLEYQAEVPASSTSNKEISIQGSELAVDKTQQIVLSKYRDVNGLHLMLNTQTGSKKIFTLNPWLSEVDMVEKEIITFTDKQGNEQKALLLLANSNKSKGLVVSCYPGTIIQANSLNRDYRFSNHFMNPLLFTSNGYNVLIPTIDTRSTDEFEEFSDFVLPAVEATIKKKQLDENKIAIIGLSQGGYLVYSIISQTNMFSAAISLAGYGNLLTLYGNFDMRYRYTQNPFENVGRLRASERNGFGGLGIPAYIDPYKYLKNSPVVHTKKIETPLLIIQGDRDFVSIEQGEEMFTHLYRQGKRVRFLRFWGEGHSINAPKNITKMWKEMLTWLEQTL